MKITHNNDGTINKNSVMFDTLNGNLYLFFSYNTLIGVEYYGDETIKKISVNDWSRTTGKYLNELEPNKENRVEHSEVLKFAEICLKKLFLTPQEQVISGLQEETQ